MFWPQAGALGGGFGLGIAIGIVIRIVIQIPIPNHWRSGRSLSLSLLN